MITLTVTFRATELPLGIRDLEGLRLVPKYLRYDEGVRYIN